MNLKQIINKSVYGTIGYISSQNDLNLLEQYILHNLPVLKEVLRDGINSILCDPDKIYTWINGIKRLQSNKILCSYISINAKRDLKYKYNYNLRAKSILANL
jgi:hypothetical protein